MDKDLSRHIRAVFDAYDEPYDPASWRQLQRRRRGRAAAVYLKWAGAAASVAVLIAAGVLLWNDSFSPGQQRQAGNPQLEQRLSGGQTGEELSAGTIGESGQLSPEEQLEEQLSGTVRSSQPDQASGPGGQTAAPDSGDRQVTSQETFAAEAQIPDEPRAEGGQAGNGNYLAAGNVEAENPNETASEAAGEIAREGAGEGDPVGDEEIVAATDPTSEERFVEEGEDRAGVPAPEADPFPQAEDFVSAGNDPVADQYTANAEEEESSAAGRFSVGFVTTSLMNYASGNTGSQVHFGAGITSGWKLSERLSLHSGLILAENSLSLNNSNSSVRESTTYAAFAPENDLSAVGNNTVVQEVSPQSMDVNLLVMDIPLNLTYRLGLGKTDLLLTGGLSSFAYLDQEYSYRNSMHLYTDDRVPAPKPVVRNESAFSHFDLARQLNLAIGTEVSLGKSSVLILEPYVKYPLGELTSEHIKFGSAGMNLRLSFQPGN